MSKIRTGLTVEEIEQFDTNGFVVVRNGISNAWVAQLQIAAEAWIETGFERKRSGEPMSEHGIIVQQEGEFVFSVEKLHNKSRIESLELLGHPLLRAISVALCGEDVSPTYEGLSIRQFENGLFSPWHQDAIHDRATRALTIIVALDPYHGANGGERLLAGSQTEKQDICALRDSRGWKTEGLEMPDLESGDMLLYDPMIAHCAPKMIEPGKVRLIDVRYRTPELATLEGFSAEWMQERNRLKGLAQWVYGKLHDGISDEESFANDTLRKAVLHDAEPDIAGLYTHKAIYPSANFCLDFKTGDKIRVQEG